VAPASRHRVGRPRQAELATMRDEDLRQAERVGTAVRTRAHLDLERRTRRVAGRTLEREAFATRVRHHLQQPVHLSPTIVGAAGRDRPPVRSARQYR